MSPEIGDVAAALAYQVKKEIAENYFGTRKILEEERAGLEKTHQEIERIWTEEVTSRLRTIARCLGGEDEARDFWRLIQRDPPHSDQDPDREKDLSLPAVLALTPRGRYRKGIQTLYRNARSWSRGLAEQRKILERKASFFN